MNICEHCWGQISDDDVVWCGDRAWCWICAEENYDEYKIKLKERTGE